MLKKKIRKFSSSNYKVLANNDQWSSWEKYQLLLLASIWKSLIYSSSQCQDSNLDFTDQSPVAAEIWNIRTTKFTFSLFFFIRFQPIWKVPSFLTLCLLNNIIQGTYKSLMVHLCSETWRFLSKIFLTFDLSPFLKDEHTIRINNVYVSIIYKCTSLHSLLVGCIYLFSLMAN